jgi:thiamine biosynthesis lipoprotein
VSEVGASFACFGATCAVFVIDDGEGDDARAAVRQARARLLDWYARFSRFDPASELSRFNADPRGEVPVSPELAGLAAATIAAARRTGGLVDATLIDEIEAAGYTGDLGAPVELAEALALAPPRRAAGPAPASRWREIAVGAETGVVRRPPGVKLDSGGLAKGMFADLLAASLGPYPSFAIDCAGDLRLGGTAGIERPVLVASPFDASTVHEYRLGAGGVATSGIGRRSWLDRRGRPAHHLLDPATGRPAYTGVVQVTALAPTALEAEIRAKAAILAGPGRAREWLPDGGVVVHDDRTAEVLPPAGPG